MITIVKKKLYAFIACLLLIAPDAKPFTPTTTSVLVGGLIGLASGFGYYKLMVKKYKEDRQDAKSKKDQHDYVDEENYCRTTLFDAVLVGALLGGAAGVFTYKMCDQYQQAFVPAAVPVPVSLLVAGGYTIGQMNRPSPGLVNYGANCFMNAALQAELNSSRVRSALTRPCMAGCQVCGNNGCVHSRVVQDTQNVLHTMLTTNNLRVAPGQLNISMRSDYFPGDDLDEQHDSSEFLGSLLADLDDPTNISVMDPIRHNGACPRKNALQALYRFNQQQIITCNICHQVFHANVVGRMLPLPIAGHQTLQQSLDGVFAPVDLIGPEQYHCANCNAYRDATTQNIPTNFPERLLLSLNRFNANGLKNHQALSIPLVLNNVRGQACNYALQGFHVHRGSARGGHYVSYVKDPATEQWYLYDDAERTPVTPVRIEQILATGKERPDGVMLNGITLRGTPVSYTAFVVCYDHVGPVPAVVE